MGKCANLCFQRGSDLSYDNLYTLNGALISCVPSHGDLGVTVDCLLKFHKHVETIAHKVGGMASNFLKSTVCRSPSFMLNILTIHLRPVLEYASPLWNTGYVGDQILLENVQRRWTKNVEGLQNMSYCDRLAHLDLFSVQGRLWRADMLLCWKIFHGESKIRPEHLFAMAPSCGTRGHIFKVLPPHVNCEARKRFFAVRVIDSWNRLPDEVVQAPSIDAFKRLLALSCHDKLYSYHGE